MTDRDSWACEPVASAESVPSTEGDILLRLNNHHFAFDPEDAAALRDLIDDAVSEVSE